jgi:hypothetical protein
MLRWFVGIAVLMLISTNPCLGQEENIEVSTYDTLNLHSPKKAARLSLFLPGAGQVYNAMAMPKGKRLGWLKVPVIYAGLGATAYLFAENQVLQRNYKKEYINRVKEGLPPGAYFDGFEVFDNQALIQLHEAHKSSRNMMGIGFLAVYGLNVLDALVQAHFVDFDVSEDLSLHVRPCLIDHQSFGFSLALRWK